MPQESMRTALDLQGFANLAAVHHSLPTSFLYEEAVRGCEGRLAHQGPLVVRTGHHTGRAPKDKFAVREPSSEEKVWWGPSNQPLSPERFEGIRRRVLAYLQGKDLFVQDCFLCADPAYRTPVRAIAESAWHSLFARHLFLQAHPDELQAYEPWLTILHAPQFHAIPELDGTRSEAFNILHHLRHRGPQMCPYSSFDDLGMRKLPTTAAEDLLEIIMRRYERASTPVTSNWPVDD